MDYSETKASTTVRALVTHTTDRILSLLKEELQVITKENKNAALEFEMIYSYGGDGSSGYSNFNQLSSKGNPVNDSSLFATSLCPLVIKSKKQVLWKNVTPSSTRFNRHISLEFTKESRQHVLNVFKDLQAQIDAFTEDRSVFTVDGRTIFIKFKFFLTLIDGKILNILTHTGSQTCPFCGATPKDFNNLQKLINGDFEPTEEFLKFGLSPLHANINIFNCLLHLSYKLLIKKWRTNASDRQKISKRKKEILTKLENSSSIKFDQPRAGGAGNSTTEKDCRKVLNEPEKLAGILELDINLVRNLSIILKVLNAREEINVSKFRELCMRTYEIFVVKYDFYKMCATMHKILAHSCDVIMVLPLSPGFFSEEGPESLNKFLKHIRQAHARTVSREANIKDMFHRSLESSDPALSSKRMDIRMKMRKHRQFPEEIQEYLILSQTDDDSCVEDLDINTDEIEEETLFDNYRFDVDFENTEYSD